MDHFEIDEEVKDIISFRFLISQDLVESSEQSSEYYLSPLAGNTAGQHWVLLYQSGSSSKLVHFDIYITSTERE